MLFGFSDAEQKNVPDLWPLLDNSSSELPVKSMIALQITLTVWLETKKGEGICVWLVISLFQKCFMVINLIQFESWIIFL